MSNEIRSIRAKTIRVGRIESEVAASMPDWLKQMSPSERADYFRAHPNSKYNPAKKQGLKLNILKKVSKKAWSKHSSEDAIKDEIESLNTKKKSVQKEIENIKEKISDIDDMSKDLHDALDAAKKDRQKSAIEKRISKVNKERLGARDRLLKKKDQSRKIREQVTHLRDELKGRR